SRSSASTSSSTSRTYFADGRPSLAVDGIIEILSNRMTLRREGDVRDAGVGEKGLRESDGHLGLAGDDLGASALQGSRLARVGASDEDPDVGVDGADLADELGSVLDLGAQHDAAGCA